MSVTSAIPSASAQPTATVARVLGPVESQTGNRRSFRLEVVDLVGELAEGATVDFIDTGREIVAENLHNVEVPAGTVVLISGGIFEFRG